MEPITVWTVITEQGNLIHNHIEDGWAEGEYPLPKRVEFTNQKAWENMKWKKEHAYLDVNYVVRRQSDVVS